jgi:hypothetical protein
MATLPEAAGQDNENHAPLALTVPGGHAITATSARGADDLVVPDVQEMMKVGTDKNTLTPPSAMPTVLPSPALRARDGGVAMQLSL